MNKLPSESPLRIIRKRLKKTLTDVSTAIELDPANLSRIERATQPAGKDVAEKLVAFFDGEISEMEIIYPERYMDKKGSTEAAA